MGRSFATTDYTVLIVDSDQRVCAELASLLERAGYETITFNSGEALLRAVEALPDNVCVIAEVELPGMTGLELTHRLREHNVYAPVIILTGLGDVPTAVRAMRDTVSDYLVKPYVERDLVRRLERVLRANRPAVH